MYDPMESYDLGQMIHKNRIMESEIKGCPLTRSGR